MAIASSSTSSSQTIIDGAQNLDSKDLIRRIFDFLFFTPHVDPIRVQSVLFAPYFAGNFDADDYLKPLESPFQQSNPGFVSSPSSPVQALSSGCRSVVYRIEHSSVEDSMPVKSANSPSGPSLHSSFEMSLLLNAETSSQVCLTLEKDSCVYFIYFFFLFCFVLHVHFLFFFATLLIFYSLFVPPTHFQVSYITRPVCGGVESLYSLIEECLMHSLRVALPASFKDLLANQTSHATQLSMREIIINILEYVVVCFICLFWSFFSSLLGQWMFRFRHL
jgi:hypothetical protein